MLGGDLSVRVHRIGHSRILVLQGEVGPRGTRSIARGLWTKGLAVGVLRKLLQLLGAPALRLAVRVQNPRHRDKLEQNVARNVRKTKVGRGVYVAVRGRVARAGRGR